MIPNIRLMRLAAAGIMLTVVASAQTAPDYDSLLQKGKTELQAGGADLALASGEQAIKISANRWEAYALAGGALMNLKRYEEAADKLSEAIKRAPEAKQPALRDLRRQCLLTESGVSPPPAALPPAKEAAPTTATQSEIVLWKSIENSMNSADFQSYLSRYPNGSFAVLAERHLEESKVQASHAEVARELGRDFPISSGRAGYFKSSYTAGVLNVHPGGMTYRGATETDKPIGGQPYFSAACSEVTDVQLGDHGSSVDMSHAKKNYTFFPRNVGTVSWTDNDGKAMAGRIFKAIREECH